MAFGSLWDSPCCVGLEAVLKLQEENQIKITFSAKVRLEVSWTLSNNFIRARRENGQPAEV